MRKCSCSQCTNERVQIISFKQQSVHFYYKEKKKKKTKKKKKVQSFTIGRRQSGNPRYRWTWYNFKYDTLFVMNWRKQISIDVQSFIICLQIIVSSWCRFVHDFLFYSTREKERFLFHLGALFGLLFKSTARTRKSKKDFFLFLSFLALPYTKDDEDRDEEDDEEGSRRKATPRPGLVSIIISRWQWEHWH